jgi:transcriptional regulator with XRE-family HTH domain
VRSRAELLDPSTPGGRLLATLKQQLKLKGLRYGAIALQLGVSEATVKRYLRGKGISLAVLQDLVEIVNLDLPSLVLLAEDQSVNATDLTERQQSALRENRVLAAVFYSLINGWTPSLIAKEFQFGEELERALVQLERLRLIRRLSSNRVKVLAKHKIGEKFTGALAELALESAHGFLGDIDLRSADCNWLLDTARLSRASAARLSDLMKTFLTEFRALSAKDRSLSPQETEWYRLFSAAQRTSREDLRKWGLEGQGPSRRRLAVVRRSV